MVNYHSLVPYRVRDAAVRPTGTCDRHAARSARGRVERDGAGRVARKWEQRLTATLATPQWKNSSVSPLPSPADRGRPGDEATASRGTSNQTRARAARNHYLCRCMSDKDGRMGLSLRFRRAKLAKELRTQLIAAVAPTASGSDIGPMYQNLMRRCGSPRSLVGRRRLHHAARHRRVEQARHPISRGIAAA